MKKRSLVMSLVLALAMVAGTFSTVFAGVGPATDVTKKAIVDSGIQIVQKIKDEVTAEKIAIKFRRGLCRRRIRTY